MALATVPRAVISKASTVKYADGTKVEVGFKTDPEDGYLILHTEKVSEAQMVRDNITKALGHDALDGLRSSSVEVNGEKARKFRGLKVGE